MMLETKRIAQNTQSDKFSAPEMPKKIQNSFSWHSSQIRDYRYDWQELWQGKYFPLFSTKETHTANP